MFCASRARYSGDPGAGPDSALAVPGTAAEKLKRVARDYFVTTRENKKLMRFVFGLIHNPPSSAPVVDIPAFYEQFVRRVADVVEDGVRSGELREGRTDLRMLVLMGAPPKRWWHRTGIARTRPAPMRQPAQHEDRRRIDPRHRR